MKTMKKEERRFPWWKRKFYVHPVQRRYFILSLIPLVVCSLLLVFMLFIPLKLALLRPDLEPHELSLISTIYPLVFRIWPAVVLTMLGYSVIFFFVTHRLVGPIPRLEWIFRRIAEGDLTIPTIYVRPEDDLRDFARSLDRAYGTLISALAAIREQEALASQELFVLQQKVRAGQNDAQKLLPALEGIGGRQTEMAKVLSYFKFPPEVARKATNQPEKG
jgi:methyl-accepting chemotaxis protein